MCVEELWIIYKLYGSSSFSSCILPIHSSKDKLWFVPQSEYQWSILKHIKGQLAGYLAI